MVVKTKVDAIFALDRLKIYQHEKDCKHSALGKLHDCTCGIQDRNELINEIQQFIKTKNK